MVIDTTGYTPTPTTTPSEFGVLTSTQTNIYFFRIVKKILFFNFIGSGLILSTNISTGGSFWGAPLVYKNILL